MAAASTITESQFHEYVDALLCRLEAVLEAAQGKVEIDSELNGGILTLTFDNDSKVIINRQTPMREIWLAARSGGYHFRLQGDPAAGAGAWQDTRSATTLVAMLTRVIAEQSGAAVDLGEI